MLRTVTFALFFALAPLSANAAVFGLSTQGGLGIGPNGSAPFQADRSSLLLGGDFFAQIQNFTWGLGAEVNMLSFSDFTVGTAQFLYGMMRISIEPLLSAFVDLKIGATWTRSKTFESSQMAFGWGGGVGYRFSVSPVVDLMPKFEVRVMPFVNSTTRTNLIYTDLSLLLSLKLF